MFKRFFSLTLAITMLFLSTATVFAEDTKPTPESEITVEKLLEVSGSNEGPLSRGAFAAMLVEAAGIPLEEIAEDAKLPQDLKPDTLYAKSVKALYDRNILRGSSDKIYPDKAITGIEAMTFVARTLGISENAIANDVEVKGLPKDHWGYAVYSWLVKDGLTLEDVDILKELDPEMGAKFLVNIFGSDRKVKAMLEESNEKNKDIKSFRANGKMAIEVEMDGPEDLEPDMPTKTKATFNSEFSNNTIHQTVETLIPGMDETIKIEQYMDKEYIYTAIPEEDGEDKWMKMKNFMSTVFDDNFLSQQQALTKEFEELAHYRLLGTEKIDGKDCYKIAMYTRLDNVSKLLDKMGIMGQQEKEAFKAANDILKGVSMNGFMYIGVDDKLVKKALINAVISMNVDGQKENPVILKAMKMDMEYDYQDYNADITIEIPEKAKDAEVIDLENLESPDDK